MQCCNAQTQAHTGMFSRNNHSQLYAFTKHRSSSTMHIYKHKRTNTHAQTHTHTHPNTRNTHTHNHNHMRRNTKTHTHTYTHTCKTHAPCKPLSAGVQLAGGCLPAGSRRWLSTLTILVHQQTHLNTRTRKHAQLGSSKSDVPFPCPRQAPAKHSHTANHTSTGRTHTQH